MTEKNQYRKLVIYVGENVTDYEAVSTVKNLVSEGRSQKQRNRAAYQNISRWKWGTKDKVHKVHLCTTFIGSHGEDQFYVDLGMKKKENKDD